MMSKIVLAVALLASGGSAFAPTASPLRSQRRTAPCYQRAAALAAAADAEEGGGLAAVPAQEAAAAAVAVLPPMIEPLGQGLLEDLRRKRKVYVSELKDGMSLQCFAATVFLFFACLAPAVAFGGLLGTVTLGQMGAMEMIVATAGSGMGYALLSGQPLTIIGSTGPV